jgi:transposase
MQILYPRCCGLDVHKASVTACILINGSEGKERHLRRFGTMTRDVNELIAWLTEHGVRKVAMESTGVYWKPFSVPFSIVLRAFAWTAKNVASEK